MIEKDHERKKKEGSFIAMNLLRSNELDALERKIREAASNTIDWKNADKQLRAELRLVLSHFERFAVAVNTNVYDIDIVDRTMGAYLIGLWEDYATYIEFIRSDTQNPKCYVEIENLVNSIKKRREPVVVREAIIKGSTSFEGGVIDLKK